MSKFQHPIKSGSAARPFQHPSKAVETPNKDLLKTEKKTKSAKEDKPETSEG